MELLRYDDKVVKKFMLATLLWGGIAFIVGLTVALQLAYWPLNLGLEWTSFGRLRPLHTNAAIFAFAGNAIFAGIYYSTQRLCKTRMASDLLSALHFWGWQLIIVCAALTLPLGITRGKEYAELEWPIGLLITVVWVIFAVNFFWTLAKRREKHLYVAIWFYIATIITVAVLHVTNSLTYPVSFLKSYSVYAGIQDALVQWWYGHNAVAFFLTTPFLGLMYYFIPKAVNRPVYSYRLSIVHFWALVFLYIWAGPHHLLYTSMPEWAQTLGMIFSVMLWAPSWGGMINGLLTLKGCWNLLRTDPIVKFMVSAITFYGMSTFEGPLLSIKSVNAIGHYTDWIIGHVHSGALGWNGMLTFGMAYYMIPRLWRTKLYSEKIATTHFWFSLTGIIFYYVSMVTAGITQALMLQDINAEGKLVYPDYVETVTRIIPLYWVRALGGVLFIIGFFIGVYNIYKTIQSAPKEQFDTEFKAPVAHVEEKSTSRHRTLEGLAAVFTVLVFLSILAGTLFEIIPTLSIEKYVKQENKVLPFTPLEVAGRDLYVREGCYTCHSQQIRPMAHEYLRYGKPTTIEESMYDHPFQWGSKRTGPDLARVGGKYPNMWHYRHMLDPRAITTQSIMPSYAHMYDKKTDFLVLRQKVSVLKNLGVPYADETLAKADVEAHDQAVKIAEDLKANGVTQVPNLEEKEIVALIAYLQALGKKAVNP